MLHTVAKKPAPTIRNHVRIGLQLFQMTLVVTSIVILCLISVLLYQLIALLEKRIR